ncbi:ATP-dependent DNA ligase [Frigoribacterium faeni]|uniref:DNA ligase (ATP) n=1 Tax=Frigoribacterium faeni TaxID=145483 RepID=A0A7W3JHR4_9MICO|nr:ATP-dependent DNA ligase [Frigoribacterium faeni]MBA8813081.1 ATP-dependent DNA ligase [Frigoribacterium faeni]BFF14261.1 ATP-dependent DNA ligase [Microbacterium flavescens]GEK84023.1 DNA ligase C [Frigoribacterium faeni]
MIPDAAHPVVPMLAKAVSEVPAPDSVPGGLSYEPKWDGFRGIVYARRREAEAGGDTDDRSDARPALDIEIGSRGSKTLTRYFPELVASLAELLPGPCVLDGEIVVRTGEPHHGRLDWEALGQRIHPAASRVAALSVETPALFVAFDLLALGDRDLLDAPFAERRALLVEAVGHAGAPLHVSRATDDVVLARRWLAEFEGAGLDGVVAKPLDAPYSPGKRTMLKIKHHRTADVVVLGYRVHKSGTGVGSLLLGLHDADGALRNVGGVSAFSDARRLELVDELAPLVARDDDGEVVHAETDRSRFSSGADVSYVPLRPERVLEVRYDQMEGSRFRHTVQFDRWRPDRDPRSCGFDQLEVPTAYDLDEVLG